MFVVLIALAVVNLVLILPARISNLGSDRAHVSNSKQQDSETARPCSREGGTND